jgi:hypothetical protein
LGALFFALLGCCLSSDELGTKRLTPAQVPMRHHSIATCFELPFSSCNKADGIRKKKDKSGWGLIEPKLECW